MSDKSDKERSISDDIREFGRRIRRRNPLLRRVTNILFYTLFPFTEGGREVIKDFKDPDFRKILLYKKYRTGLLEDSILFPTLYSPNDEGTSLQYDTAVAGQWIAYDFHRKAELGEDMINRGKGRLLAYPLEEIIHNPSNAYTPTWLIEPFDVGQALQFVCPSIEELLEWGLIEETTYEEAFQRVGLSDDYALDMELKGIADDRVYAITPKGNGLVFLSGDAGRKSEDPSYQRKLVPVFGH